MWTRVDPLHPDGRSRDRRPHAVVVGSGFGGLAAAVRLGARGYRVTVLERNEQPGGRASVFRQDGFTFDAGPTIITLPQLFEELWALCGRRLRDDVKLTGLDPFYRIVYADGSSFAMTGDPEKLRAEVERLAPADAAGFERFVRDARPIYEFAFEDLGQQPFSTLMPLLKAVPNFVRFRAERSVYSHAARYVKDERLRFALSFHPLFIGGNPFRVTSLYALVSHLERQHGVHFAYGGTGALVKGLVSLIEGQGGTIRLNADVAEITTQNRIATGVKLASGEEIPAQLVVANGDPGHVHAKMLPSIRRKRWTDAKIARSAYSMSLFVWYFGTNRRFEDVDHHTILLGPRYRGLLDDIFRRKILAEDFSLYIHRPTATDPSLAPEGCDAFYVLSPVPHLESGTDWEHEAEPYRRKIEAVLEKRLMPGLKASVISSKLFTPIDFRDRLLSVHGAAFGIEPVITQSAWFRPHNESEEVKNLYFVGAGTHPGAGVPGVLCSAKILDKVVPHAATLV